MPCNNCDDLLRLSPIYKGDLYITQQNIYNGAFIAKIMRRKVYSQKSPIIDACLGSFERKALIMSIFGLNFPFKISYLGGKKIFPYRALEKKLQNSSTNLRIFRPSQRFKIEFFAKILKNYNQFSVSQSVRRSDQS